MIKAIITVFASSGMMPTPNDILFCSEETPATVIEAFVMRALLYDDKQYPRAFVIAHFQRLGFQVQSRIFEFMHLMERDFGSPRFCLYIFSVTPDLKQTNLVESVRADSRPFTHYLNDMQFRNIVDKLFGNVVVYRSETCGLGKTEKIKDLVANSKEEGLTYARIPFYGSLNRDSLIKLHIEKTRAGTAFAFHYDVYPCEGKNKNLNVVMFELLFLGCLTSADQTKYFMPEQVRVFVEMSQSLNEHHFFLLFQLFETVTLKWDYRNIKVSKNPEDPC